MRTEAIVPANRSKGVVSELSVVESTIPRGSVHGNATISGASLTLMNEEVPSFGPINLVPSPTHVHFLTSLAPQPQRSTSTTSLPITSPSSSRSMPFGISSKPITSVFGRRPVVLTN